MQKTQQAPQAEQSECKLEYLQWECRRETTWLRFICLAHFAAEQFEVPGAVTVQKVHIW